VPVTCPSYILFLTIPFSLKFTFLHFLLAKRVKDSREEGGEVRPDRDIGDEEIQEMARSGKLIVFCSLCSYLFILYAVFYLSVKSFQKDLFMTIVRKTQKLLLTLDFLSFILNRNNPQTFSFCLLTLTEQQ
jgi:hypothetical protein